jgi:hypothetical protein
VLDWRSSPAGSAGASQDAEGGSRHAGGLPPVADLFDFGLELQQQCEQNTSVKRRKSTAQYITPSAVCKFVAGLFMLTGGVMFASLVYGWENHGREFSAVANTAIGG